MAQIYKDKSKDSLTTTQKSRSINRREQRDRYAEQQLLAQQHSDRTMDSVMDARNTFYAGLDPRRKQEVADSGLIREDHNAMANLPRMAQHHEWPTVGYFGSPYIDALVEE